MTAVQMTAGSELHLFGTIKGEPLEGAEGLDGVYRCGAIYEKPTQEYAAKHLKTPGLPAGQYLCHFGLHVFPPAIFEAIEHHIKCNIREKGEIQLTNAQEYMRTQLIQRYGVCTVDGKRYDTGIPYGLMESQIALALAGKHRAQIVEAIARLLAEQLVPVAKR